MKALIKIVFLFFIAAGVTSCGSSRKNFQENKSKITDHPSGGTENVHHIKATGKAMDFLGTRYRYGGISRKGMDCSGLILTAFLEEDISLPRTARDMALQGSRLKLKEVGPGDLLFFETNKNTKVINHVGLVVEKKGGELMFIHSSTSRGVIISSLNENYWQQNFVMARRIE